MSWETFSYLMMFHILDITERSDRCCIWFVSWYGSLLTFLPSSSSLSLNLEDVSISTIDVQRLTSCLLDELT